MTQTKTVGNINTSNFCEYIIILSSSRVRAYVLISGLVPGVDSRAHAVIIPNIIQPLKESSANAGQLSIKNEIS